MSRRQVAAAAEAQGIPVVDVMVSPSVANPFGADVEVRTPDGYVPGRHTWLPTPAVTLRPEALVPLRRIPPAMDPARAERILARAEKAPDVRHYLTWSRFPYVSITARGDGWAVRYSERLRRWTDRSKSGWRPRRYRSMTGRPSLARVAH